MTAVPTPVEISDVTMAFPANALEFMPAYDDIPTEFKDPSNPWARFQQTWFSHGMSNHFSFVPHTVDPEADSEDDEAERYDAKMIYRQLAAIQGSYAPKHEHKVAAIAYLASCWIESLFYGKPGDPVEEHVALGEGSLEEWLEHFAKRDAGEVELKPVDE